MRSQTNQVKSLSDVATDLVAQPESPVNKFKNFLKGYRPFYRFIFGVKALKVGIAGLFRGRRGAKEHLLSTFSFVTGSEVVRGRPMNITIEPTSACNLACPICETGAKTLGRATQHMSMADYKTILDKIAPYTNTLMFYFMGEPFVNREAYDMIAYAKSSGIPFVTTCTNGDYVDAKKLIASGIDEVSFQIGGITQKTHETYRVNSNLARVLENLKATVRLRNESGSKMRISSSLILMKHNEHEIDGFMKLMSDIGVDEPAIRDPWIRTYEEGVKYLPTDQNHWKYDPVAFKSGVLKPKFLPPNECPWVNYSLSIHVNGNVVPCCWDPTGLYVVGNLITESLDAVWNGPKYRAFRKQLHKDQGQLEICRLCSAYPHSPIN